MTTRNRAPVLDRLIHLPGAFTEGPVDRFGHKTYIEGPRRQTWAMRIDLTGRETLQISDSVITNVQVRRYIIRFAEAAVGDSITDDEGNERTILGRAETAWGRDRFLELTCELIR